MFNRSVWSEMWQEGYRSKADDLIDLVVDFQDMPVRSALEWQCH